MGKDIKLKDNLKYVKTKNNKENLKRFVKKRMISSVNQEKSDNENNTKTNTSFEATKQVTVVAKGSFIKTKERMTKFINQQINKLMVKQLQNKHSNKQSELHPMRIDKKIKGKTYYSNTSNMSACNNNMKNYYIHKYKIKHQQTSKVHHTKSIIIKFVDIAKKTFDITKKSVLTVSHIFSFGTGILLLIIVTLFIGVFGSLSDSSVYGVALSPLSKEVLAYTDTINKYTEQYGVEEYTPLVQAIMMHESKGLGNDSMNSSSFIYNTSYPEGINDSDYSIYVGGKVFS